jgi:hypothetical protein
MAPPPKSSLKVFYRKLFQFFPLNNNWRPLSHFFLVFNIFCQNLLLFLNKFILFFGGFYYYFRELARLRLLVCVTSSNGGRMQATDSICWLIRNVSVSLFADFVVFITITDWWHHFWLLSFEKKGHFIGKVDPNTPASAGGLKVGDRIIEVNGHNVVNETHKQVKF